MSVFWGLPCSRRVTTAVVWVVKLPHLKKKRGR